MVAISVFASCDLIEPYTVARRLHVTTRDIDDLPVHLYGSTTVSFQLAHAIVGLSAKEVTVMLGF